jgi:hypothetical protein
MTDVAQGAIWPSEARVLQVMFLHCYCCSGARELTVSKGTRTGLPGQQKPCYLVAQALSLNGARYSNVAAALSEQFDVGPFS